MKTFGRDWPQTFFSGEKNMKNRISLGIVCALFAVPFLAPQAASAQCSNATLTGGWAYIMQNTFFYSAFPEVAELGLFTFDGAGNFTLTDTRSILGEPVLHLEISQGNYFVDADCTGELILHRNDPPFLVEEGLRLVHISFTLVGPANITASLVASDTNYQLFVTANNSNCGTGIFRCNAFQPFYTGTLSKQ